MLGGFDIRYLIASTIPRLLYRHTLIGIGNRETTTTIYPIMNAEECFLQFWDNRLFSPKNGTRPAQMETFGTQVSEREKCPPLPIDQRHPFSCCPDLLKLPAYVRAHSINGEQVKRGALMLHNSLDYWNMIFVIPEHLSIFASTTEFLLPGYPFHYKMI